MNTGETQDSLADNVPLFRCNWWQISPSGVLLKSISPDGVLLVLFPAGGTFVRE